MKFVIVQTGTTFGKGYFVGFHNDNAYFQSCYDKYVKTYKTQSGAEKQIDRIVAERITESDTVKYSVESVEAGKDDRNKMC